MPIPKVQGPEKEETFISRCIEQIVGEYGEEQAAAICYGVWRDTKNLSSQGRVLNKINQINLLEPNPCQEGYIAYGTKIKDGREVPNCVPID